MANSSHIEWTDATWNPVTGCTKISPGCKHCYAERLAHRLQSMGQPNYKNGFKLTLQPHMLDLPLRWRAPKRIFVNSMSDLFHKDVPTEYIRHVFAIMAQANWHQFQVLTKRSERLRELSATLPWPAHIWQGVSIENDNCHGRADDLRATSAAVKFLSLEPLLGSLPNLDLQGIDWVIVGGESGPGARHMEPSWVIDIRKKCRKAGVAFFFKQWGGVQKSKHGRTLEGRTWDEMPADPAFAIL
jgi:protein gp37